MKRFKLWMSVLLLSSIQGCYTTEMAYNSDGLYSYETGREVLYWPRIRGVTAVRGYKDIAFPLELQERLVSYRKDFGIWPYSMEGFMAQSDKNRDVVYSLSHNGYKDLLFVTLSDTLFIYFRFATHSIVNDDFSDDKEISTNLIPSVWKYYPSADGNFGFEQDLYVDY